METIEEKLNTLKIPKSKIKNLLKKIITLLELNINISPGNTSDPSNTSDTSNIIPQNYNVQYIDIKIFEKKLDCLIETNQGRFKETGKDSLTEMDNWISQIYNFYIEIHVEIFSKTNANKYNPNEFLKTLKSAIGLFPYSSAARVSENRTMSDVYFDFFKTKLPYYFYNTPEIFHIENPIPRGRSR